MKRRGVFVSVVAAVCGVAAFGLGSCTVEPRGDVSEIHQGDVREVNRDAHQIRSAPSSDAEVVGEVDYLDCSDIDDGAAPHVFIDGGMWYRVGDGWVLNDDWCI